MRPAAEMVSDLPGSGGVTWAEERTWEWRVQGRAVQTTEVWSGTTVHFDIWRRSILKCSPPLFNKIIFSTNPEVKPIIIIARQDTQ